MNTATTEQTPLVEVRGLHTYYGNSHILHGVDLHIAPGETLALMGRNGMGKSTTIRSLLGLTPPRRGEVWIKGENLTGSPTHKVIRRGIGYVPEGRGMFPNLSVRESLVMAARPGVDGRRDWTLERVLETFPRLAERYSHLTGNLSGGEQQMVAIGRALMSNPDLMILDEATEGLAPLIRREIWQVIRLVKASGIATLVVDKNVNVLLDLTDRSMIMVKGRVVYDGPSQALKGQPEILQTHIGL
ncbi:ABC transporter ATP-binding protein [Pseudomonas sp. 2FE]|uniref:ABC transporter ATP-binding protein n=1 Tax=Pseudomonas sp. 2FE TaxID=2502190 RepID=UPI0010F906E4|nr:ABC transporter ATP-binding protein [Pseudomonas sp. 2FE]